MSERLIPARWGGAALPAGASLPLPFPSRLLLRCAMGPRARATSLLWVPPAPSALPARGTGVCLVSLGLSHNPGGEPHGDSVQTAGVEPRGAPHPRLQGPTSSATPFLAPARREAGLSVPPCRVPIYPTSPRAREAWRMTGELALYRAAPVQQIVPSGGTLRQSCEGEAASPYVIDEGTEAEW